MRGWGGARPAAWAAGVPVLTHRFVPFLTKRATSAHFVEVSRRVMVRLKTGRWAVWSVVSGVK